MKTYKIHLIRHGLTDANERGLYIGRTDLPLSPAGLNRLLEMKKAGGYPPARRFFTSPLLRCRQTMEVLYPGSRAEILPGLAECDFGEWDGRSVHELKSDPRFQEWLTGARTDIPGGEAAEAFQARVTAEFERWRAGTDKRRFRGLRLRYRRRFLISECQKGDTLFT